MAKTLAQYKAAFAYHTSRRGMTVNINGTRRVLAKLGPWLKRYRGGLPLGVFAAFAWYESNGKMNAPGDNVLGEVGYFQIARYIPKHFGLPENSRKDPETNVFLGGLEYNEEVARFASRYPQIVMGTADSWKIARLVFAVGRGGVSAILKASQPLVRGNVYGSIISYIDGVGGIDLGRAQPAPKVWFRVMMVPVAYSVGQRAYPGKPDKPRLLPTPRNVNSYRIAPKLRKLMLPNKKPPYRKKMVSFRVWPVVLGAIGVGLLFGRIRRKITE